MTALLFCVGLAILLGLEEAGAFFIPGDISLIAAGIHGRADAAPLFLIAAWAVSTAAMTGGATILFHGVQQSNRLDRVLPNRVRSLIRYHGAVGVFGARILPGLRNATVFAAATAKLRYRTLLEGLIPAAAVWSAILLLLGWFGGSAMLAAYHQLHQHRSLKIISFALLVASLLFVAGRLWTTRHHHRAHRNT